MSLDKSAIQEIQLSTATKEANNCLSIQKDLRSRPSIVLHKDFEVKDIEIINQFRYRYRGTFFTKCLNAFGDYAETYKSETQQAVFINAKSMNARLVLNLGNDEQPGHCDHAAIIELEKTAAYNALLKIVDSRQGQREIAEFIEDWHHCLSAQAEDEQNIPIVKALQAVRSITIEAVKKQDNDVRNFGATTTGMESIDAKSKHTLPAKFLFTCEPYSGLKMRSFELRLSIISENTPKMILRIIREQEHEEAMADEFQQLIKTELTDKSPEVKTYIGLFQH